MTRRKVGKPSGRKPSARPSKADVIAHTELLARAYVDAIDRLLQAQRALDPLAAAVEAIGMGKAWPHMLWLSTAKDRRDMRRHVGKYAPRGKAARS